MRHPTPRRLFPRVYKYNFRAGYLDTCKVACLALSKCDAFYVRHATHCILVGEGITRADIALAATASKVAPWGLWEGNGGKGEVVKTNGDSNYTCWRKSGAVGTLQHPPLPPYPPYPP